MLIQAYINMMRFFWVQADDPDKIANSFRDIAIELHLIQVADAADPVVIRNIVMELLSTPYKASLTSNEDTPNMAQKMANWLIIFDNADNPELLRDFWPVSGNGSALVTSRDPLAKTYLHSTRGIDLQPFVREEAATFLQRLTTDNTDSQNDREATLVLASDRLGGFPLALVHVAAIIRRKGLAMNEMLERYDKKTFNLELYDSTGMSTHDKYAHTLSTVWAVEDLGKPALNLLDLIAFLEPNAIPESILEVKIDRYPTDEFCHMQKSYEEARISLTGASLIKRDRDKKQLTVHRVAQEGTRNRMSAQRLKMVFGLIVELLLKAWYHEPEEKFTHVKALWDVAKVVSPHETHVRDIFERQRLQLEPENNFEFARLLQKNGW